MPLCWRVSAQPASKTAAAMVIVFNPPKVHAIRTFEWDPPPRRKCRLVWRLSCLNMRDARSEASSGLPVSRQVDAERTYAEFPVPRINGQSGEGRAAVRCRHRRSPAPALVYRRESSRHARRALRGAVDDRRVGHRSVGKRRRGRRPRVGRADRAFHRRDGKRASRAGVRRSDAGQDGTQAGRHAGAADGALARGLQGHKGLGGGGAAKVYTRTMSSSDALLHSAEALRKFWAELGRTSLAELEQGKFA